MRAVGENPHTADAKGISVGGTRYLYTMMGGALVGLGAAHLSLAYTPGWTENLTGGRGWIAIALVIFAMWDPWRAVLGAPLFGVINAIQFRLQAMGTPIPAAFLGDVALHLHHRRARRHHLVRVGPQARRRPRRARHPLRPRRAALSGGGATLAA